MAADYVGFDLVWEGDGLSEKAIDRKLNKTIVKINQKFYRPSEVDLLIGDPTKAKNILDWYPKTSLESLCEMMVKNDLDRNKNGLSY